MHSYDPDRDSPDFSAQSFGTGIESFPYEVVQSGFHLLWLANGFTEAARINGDERGLLSIRRTVHQLPLDPVLHPDLAPVRVVANSKLRDSQGSSILLLEFMNARSTPVFWYGGGMVQIETGSAMLAVREVPGQNYFSIYAHLDPRAFEYDRSRVQLYERTDGQLDAPLLVRLIESQLLDSVPDAPPVVLRVRATSSSDIFQVSTSAGAFVARYSCNDRSRLVECGLRRS